MGKKLLDKVVLLGGLSDAWFCALLFTFATLLYVNTLSAGYVWDDRAAIVGNADVTQSNDLSMLFLNDFWGQDMSLSSSHKSYRPVTVLSFRLNHMLHGLVAKGYHGLNIIIYGITVTLGYYMARLWLSNNAARFASLLFCFHPVHVEAVASLVGRADCLCGLFYFATIIAYTNAMRESESLNANEDEDNDNTIRNRWLYVTSLYALSFLCAVATSLSKEIGVTVFGILILIEISTKIADHRKEMSKKTTKVQVLTVSSFQKGFNICLRGTVMTVFQWTTSCVRVVLIVTVAVTFMYFRLKLNGDSTTPSWTLLENHISLLPSFKQRALSYAQSHFWYAFKLVFPRYLCFDYGYACINTIDHAVDWRNILPLAVYSSITYLIYYSIRHVRVSLLMGLALFLIPLLPALNIFLVVGTVLAERLLFLPSMGFCMLVAEILMVDNSALWESDHNIGAMIDKNQPSTIIKRVLSYMDALHLFVLTLSILGSMRIITRNLDWNSEFRIYESALEVCPLSTKALTNYAVLSGSSQQWTHKSLASALSALDVYKGQSGNFMNVGVVYSRMRQYARSAWYSEQGLLRKQRDGKLWGYLGSTYYEWALAIRSKAKDGQDISQQFQILQQSASNAMDNAFRNSQAPPSLYHTRGSMALDQQDMTYAIECFQKAIQLNAEARALADDVPLSDLTDEMHTYNQLGNAYGKMGNNEEAISAYEKGLTYDEDNLPILINLGSLYRAMNDVPRAKEYFHTALAVYDKLGISPSSAILNNFALVELDSANYKAAEELLLQALEEIRKSKSDTTLEAQRKRTPGAEVTADGIPLETLVINNLAKVRSAAAGNEL